MNRRSSSDAQLALPGLAPLCPHCGGRRTELSSAEDEEQGMVSGQHWQCRACGRGFWSLPSLGSAAPRGPRR
jgi:uncharacterized protein with PIN domain